MIGRLDKYNSVEGMELEVCYINILKWCMIELEMDYKSSIKVLDSVLDYKRGLVDFEGDEERNIELLYKECKEEFDYILNEIYGEVLK